MQRYRRGVIKINGKALQDNVLVLREHTTPARLLAILKANAYGHGLINTARTLQKTVDGFGVACLDEALQLRKANIKNTIVILEGALSKEEYIIASEFKLDVVIHDEYQYQWLVQLPEIKPIRIWLKVNTGMNRLGIAPDKVQPFIRKLNALSTIKAIVMMSHLAGASHPHAAATKQQYNIFKRCISQVVYTDLTYSLANSAAIFACPGLRYHWVRPGLALYGISPFKKDQKSDVPLKAVMTLKAKIIAIQSLKPGEYIGYDSKFQCQSAMRIGIVSFGYGDGYPYNAPAGTPVLLQEKERVPLVGQVSMDMLTIDLSQAPYAQIGDEVTLWGEGLRLEEVACHTHRSCYELLCGIQRESHARLGIQVV